MKPVNRLATPLPQSVLDRYHAEHPEEPKTAAKAEPVAVVTKDAKVDFDEIFEV